MKKMMSSLYPSNMGLSISVDDDIRVILLNEYYTINGNERYYSDISDYILNKDGRIFNKKFENKSIHKIENENLYSIHSNAINFNNFNCNLKYIVVYLHNNIDINKSLLIGISFIDTNISITSSLILDYVDGILILDDNGCIVG